MPFPASCKNGLNVSKGVIKMPERLPATLPDFVRIELARFFSEPLVPFGTMGFTLTIHEGEIKKVDTFRSKQRITRNNAQQD
jgi:hypothetical protein